jgi:hypothetical protein
MPGWQTLGEQDSNSCCGFLSVFKRVSFGKATGLALLCQSLQKSSMALEQAKERETKDATLILDLLFYWLFIISIVKKTF